MCLARILVSRSGARDEKEDGVRAQDEEEEGVGAREHEGRNRKPSGADLERMFPTLPLLLRIDSTKP